ncbi:MAG: hypothetical protein R3F11_28545 [Verrucomicrobiales bacterium]
MKSPPLILPPPRSAPPRSPPPPKMRAPKPARRNRRTAGSPSSTAKDLDSWKVNRENPKSVYVKDGLLVIDEHAPTSSTTVGRRPPIHRLRIPRQGHDDQGSNSGIYFATEYQKDGW